MTATQTIEAEAREPNQALRDVLADGSRPAPASAFAASFAFGWRAMLKIKHDTEQLIDVTVFPVIMTLMFTFLFGGALSGSPDEYVQYLLPGILVMSVMVITMYTGMGVNVDIAKGVFDRIRTLPIWRPSALVGALLGDVFRYTAASATVVVVGLLIGFRPAGGVLGVLAGVALLVVFAFGFSWIWTMFGLLLRTEKAVMGVSSMVLFPSTFLSNVLVEPGTMPGWLQAFVDVNPVTHVVAAVRSAMHGTWDTGAIAWTLGAAVVLTAVFGAVTMRLYNRR
ncbi:ABC transporter permease [Saccharomonospora xinjiangensis]|uniref:Transport permease protein n=1 Tax=Saccharomonospora xinjiangensis XJ-54 TaxID=882086 RepID=I0UWZ3_9PSEU|nr:ABC transporter permease [Saccharomonospora xinjiangensis]EID52396.1 ABC-type multidrug transport system, permease component [Saccharomonospora xinjiangensis XJ-54]